MGNKFKILSLILIIFSNYLFSQVNVKVPPLGYLSPYFQNNVKIKDSLGVEKHFISFSNKLGNANTIGIISNNYLNSNGFANIFGSWKFYNIINIDSNQDTLISIGRQINQDIKKSIEIYRNQIDFKNDENISQKLFRIKNDSIYIFSKLFGNPTYYNFLHNEFSIFFGYNQKYLILKENGVISIGRNANSDYSTSIYIGNYAGENKTSAEYNVGIGYASLSGGLGSYNTAVGYYSLTGNTGTANSCFGANSGRDLNGGNNVLIGFWSGYQMSGSNNVSIGFECGAMSYGDDNTFTGFGAGKNSNTYLSTFIGRSSGFFQSGYSNISIGGFSGNYANANFSVFLGYNSGYFSVGNTNVFLGFNSGMYSNGNNNIFNGLNCGSSSQGSYNVFLGREAGMNSFGDNNIYIGNEIGKGYSGSFNIFLNTGRNFMNKNLSNVFAVGNLDDTENTVLLFGNLVLPNKYLKVNGNLISNNLSVDIKKVQLTYNMQYEDGIILADATGGNVQINLEHPYQAKGKIILIKKIDSSTNYVQINCSGCQIDGQNSYYLYFQYDNVMLVSDGLNYHIFN